MTTEPKKPTKTLRIGSCCDSIPTSNGREALMTEAAARGFKAGVLDCAPR